MAKNKNTLWQSEENFELTSMIDVVFLLLIYFMYLPMEQEADLMYTLPASTPPENKNVQLPNDISIEVMPDGSIKFNGASYDSPNSRNLPELTSTLSRLRESDEKGGVPTVVTIIPDSDSPHQAAVSILNACAKARIKSVSFSEPF